MDAHKIPCKFLLMIMVSTGWASYSASGLDQFFKSMGGQTNSTGAGAFTDQAAGYYTGGGYVMRQNNTLVQPLNISLPKLGVGCNSLDLYFGAFSFLKGGQAGQLLRSIGTGAPTYALQLGLKTVAPQIENTLSQLRKYIQDMNNAMLNACQASQQIVGGLWPRESAASEQICQDNQRGGNEDWFGARKHCDKPGSINAGVSKAQEKNKDLLHGEYNLVWHVMKKMEAYKNNHQLANFVMSVTGTLVSRLEGERYRLRVIEPRADQKEFIAAYLKGGSTSQLTCDETDKCLAPKLTSVTIQDNIRSPNASMKARVNTRITEIRLKYMTNGILAPEEVGFLNDAVNLPVYRYIQVSAAAGTPFLMQDAAEFIAAHMLLAQFDKVISEILEAIGDMQKIQIEDGAIEQFRQNLQASRARVQALLVGASSGSLYVLNQEIQAIENMIVSRNT